MSYSLWLDDIRDPPNGAWTIVRSFQEFVEVIEEKGLPAFISFDHDLGLEAGSGMDCAKWLVEKEYVLLHYYVHSQNPVGAKNIYGLLDQWKAFRLDPQQGDLNK